MNLWEEKATLFRLQPMFTSSPDVYLACKSFNFLNRDIDMRKAQSPLPPGILDWYNRKMAQANRPKTDAQRRVLEAYSNYLLKDLVTSGN